MESYSDEDFSWSPEEIIKSASVGKTSIITPYVQKSYLNNTTPTVGGSLFVHRLVVDNFPIKLQIWDTAGQERYRSVVSMFYRGTNAAIIVFDVTSQQTFESVQEWVAELKTIVESPMVLCVVGNKIDLRENRQVTRDEAYQYARSIGASYHECSAMQDQIWDTADQERYHSIIPQYYRDAKVALLVFEIISQPSFEKMQRWFAELKDNISPMVLCVIGNKTDLEEQRQVTKKQAQYYAESIGASYYECSAKKGRGIREVFDDVARRMISLLENITGSSEVRSAANTETISLTNLRFGPSTGNNAAPTPGGPDKSQCNC
ncbi:hypothetical protein Zmor_020211 [Zophobas morio]|uniref:Uncharacterized protein n=1 Tax=Zophobas morio TaxID=2755281 RepID=A0AA38I2Y6_9CUCU|nr:hypothetical protein Zmor_020211 [Zophobas morio]